MKPFLLRALSALCVVLSSALSPAEEPSSAPAEASTEEVERCVSQHDSARQLRLSEQWVAARAAMTDCAADRCPLAIGADCRTWLEELNRTLPTLLVLIEREDKAPDYDRRVELDGRVEDLAEPPAPLELLPGPHHLRVLFHDRAAIELDFSLEKGEKNHLERILLPAPPPRLRLSPGPPSPHARPIPTATYVLSASALAAFTGATALLFSALRSRDEARMNCAPSCDPSVRKSIETRLLLSDVSAGAGIALGAWALYTFVRRPTVAAEASLASPSIVASRNSVGLSWQGKF